MNKFGLLEEKLCNKVAIIKDGKLLVSGNMDDIVKDGDRFRLEVVEQKTGKSRVFTVPLLIQQYIENYCLRNNIRHTDICSRKSLYPLG